MNKKVAIFSDVNPTKSYSCIQYLAEALYELNVSVDLYAKIPTQDICHTKKWRFNVKSVYCFSYGKIPVLRRLIAKIHFFILSAFIYQNIIIHELTFFRVAWLAKKINKKLKVIHYATELYDESDEPTHKSLLKFYRNHSSLPDLIVECNEQRSDLRRKMFRARSPMVVIPNTIPIDSNVALDNISNDSCCKAFNNAPLKLIYTGAAYLHRELDRIIDAFSMCNLSDKLSLVLVCYGPEVDVKRLRDYCDSTIPGRYVMYTNLSRDEALKYVAKSDMGIVYYRPSLSMGNRFAAPTKFYEYLSLGLPVVCSNNDSLMPILDEYNIGKYVKDESVEALSNAILEVYHALVNKQLSRTEIRHIFIDKLEYGVSSKNSINIIVNELVGNE
ncbi:glycosyltransferase [Aeromonas veronii]|uniref:glycosyltransferase n=1 Tax=Aeromonas veronii TaxID=654 RepID=UPI003F681ED9